jgi:hypothetical protein
VKISETVEKNLGPEEAETLFDELSHVTARNSGIGCGG